MRLAGDTADFRIPVGLGRGVEYPSPGACGLPAAGTAGTCTQDGVERTGEIEPGETGRMTVDLPAGTYEMYDPAATTAR